MASSSVSDTPARAARSLGSRKNVNHDTDVSIHTETTKLLMKNCREHHNRVV
jgi:hypothetical protein